jgi:CRP-like cAMP-binding protein
MDELFQYLQTLYPLSIEMKATLINRFTKETHRKNKTLLSTGQCCDWMGFIEKGLVKVCYDIPGGEERVICFQRTGEMICGIKSLGEDIPSKVSILAMDETVIRKIRKVELIAICDRQPLFNIHLRKIIETQSALMEEHYLLLTLAPRDRLGKLKTEDAWFLRDHRIRGYMIAAYLGIDKATYSRFRNSK